MKIRINGLENEIKLNKNNVNILQIDNQNFFAHIVEILNDKANDLDNNEIVLLDENNQELDFSNRVYVLIDIFNIDFNSKKILNKIYDYISKTIGSNQEKFINNKNINIRKKLINEINDLPFNFNIKDEIEVNDLLKVYNLKIDYMSYNGVLNKIELLIEILSILKIADILVIPNLKSYLNEEELVELYKYCMYNNINLIIIENKVLKKLKYEKILRVDEEFDESID